MAGFTHGRVVWRELMTTDVEAAKRFYGELFGWRFETAKMPGMDYTLVYAGDRQIAGIAPMMPGMQAPPNWMSYVSVPDVDGAASTAKAQGGQVHLPPTDIPNVGRFAVLADPTGAVTAAFKSSSGDQEVGMPKPGEFCWETLNTTDIPKAQAFYTAVYGWKVGTFGPDMPTFGVGDGPSNQVASVMQPPPGVPSHWITYAVVTDLAAARERVKKLGGTVLMDSVDVPGVGTFAVVQDPQKAIICPFQPAMG